MHLTFVLFGFSKFVFKTQQQLVYSGLGAVQEKVTLADHNGCAIIAFLCFSVSAKLRFLCRKLQEQMTKAFFEFLTVPELLS